jgi:hypothetical protein
MLFFEWKLSRFEKTNSKLALSLKNLFHFSKALRTFESHNARFSPEKIVRTPKPHSNETSTLFFILSVLIHSLSIGSLSPRRSAKGPSRQKDESYLHKWVCPQKKLKILDHSLLIKWNGIKFYTFHLWTYAFLLFFCFLY